MTMNQNKRIQNTIGYLIFGKKITIEEEKKKSKLRSKHTKLQYCIQRKKNFT